MQLVQYTRLLTKLPGMLRTGDIAVLANCKSLTTFKADNNTGITGM